MKKKAAKTSSKGRAKKSASKARKAKAATRKRTTAKARTQAKPKSKTKVKSSTKAQAVKPKPKRKGAAAPAPKATPPAAARPVGAKIETVPPPAPRPVSPPVRSNEELAGTVTHFYSDLMVAVLQMNQGRLRVGDRIHIQGHTTDFEQTVESMQIEHADVEEAEAGQTVGLKIIEHAREHDQVYKILGSPA